MAGRGIWEVEEAQAVKDSILYWENYKIRHEKSIEKDSETWRAKHEVFAGSISCNIIKRLPRKDKKEKW